LLGERIELVTAPSASADRVKVDPTQIEQVILNLAVNARDAMPEGGRVTIETGEVELPADYQDATFPVAPGRYVRLAVSDTGIGMNESVRSHIFEPFFTTKQHSKGTGLGLPTVYGIVKQSGGYIWVRSEPGKGTTFEIFLPQVESDVEPAEPSVATSGSSPRGSETVLLVEDEAAVRALARATLVRHGYHVLEAHDGSDALTLAERHRGPIDLLLTDVVMPGMSGRELVSRLTPLRPTMRVVYMSGYSDDAIAHHGVLDPGTAFFQKPFTPRALAQMVRDVLDLPRTS
jgi:CheY-like chemotaxis protein